MASRTLPAVTLPIGTAAYAIGDVIGGKLTLSNNVGRVGVGGEAKSIIVGDAQQKNIPMTLVLFDADPSTSTLTDKTPPNIAAADIPKIVGEISVGTANYRSVAGTFNRSEAFVAASPGIPFGQALYGVMLAGGTTAWSGTTSVTVRVGVGD